LLATVALAVLQQTAHPVQTLYLVALRQLAAVTAL